MIIKLMYNHCCRLENDALKKDVKRNYRKRCFGHINKDKKKHWRK